MTLIKKEQLYPVVIAFSLLGYGWIGSNYYFENSHEHFLMDVCLFKNVTGVPCPSCGMTRSIVALLGGDVSSSLFLHPLGVVVSLALLLFPVWIAFDVFRSNQSFYNFYSYVEQLYKRKSFVYPSVVFALTLWCWNILKTLKQW